LAALPSLRAVFCAQLSCFTLNSCR